MTDLVKLVVAEAKGKIERELVTRAVAKEASCAATGAAGGAAIGGLIGLFTPAPGGTAVGMKVGAGLGALGGAVYCGIDLYEKFQTAKTVATMLHDHFDEFLGPAPDPSSEFIRSAFVPPGSNSP